MRDFIKDYMAYVGDSEVPEVYSYWTAIALVSTALGGKCWAEIRGGRRIRPNLYIILVGESGSRKSVSVMRLGKELIFKHDGLSELLNFTGNKFTKEALIRGLATNVKTEHEIGGYRHSSMAIFSSEMEVMMSDKYENRSMAMMLTELYDGTPFKYETKGSGVDIVPNPYLTILAGTTPSSIGKMMDNSIVDAGFTPRIMFVMSKNEKVVPFESLDDALMPPILERLHRIALTVGAFKLSEAANNRYGELYINMRSEAGIKGRICQDPKLKNWYSRKQDLVIKVSTCLAASAGMSIIETKHIDAALEAIEDAERDMESAMHGISDNPTANAVVKVRNIIRNRKVIGKGALSLELLGMHSKLDIEDAINLLKSNGEISEAGISNSSISTLKWIAHA